MERLYLWRGTHRLYLRWCGLQKQVLVRVEGLRGRHSAVQLPGGQVLSTRRSFRCLQLGHLLNLLSDVSNQGGWAFRCVATLHTDDLFLNGIKTFPQVFRCCQKLWGWANRGRQVHFLCRSRKISFFQLLCLILEHVWRCWEGKLLRWIRINRQSRYGNCFGKHLLLRHLLSIIKKLSVLVITAALRISLIESLLEKRLLILYNWLLLLILLVLLPHVGHLLGRLKWLLLLVNHDIW